MKRSETAALQVKIHGMDCAEDVAILKQAVLERGGRTVTTVIGGTGSERRTASVTLSLSLADCGRLCAACSGSLPFSPVSP